MFLKRYIRNPLRIILVIISVIVITVLMRETSLNRNRLPLEVTHKIRNISAKEEEWQIAATAQPGDVLEHFLLMRLPEGEQRILKEISVSSLGFDKEAYRENTFASMSEGIGKGSSKEQINSFFSESGLKFDRLRPGEFIDIKWQSRLKDDIAFKKSQAPVLETYVIVSAHDFSQTSAKTLVSLFSTIERSEIKKTARFYMPKIIGMNQRNSFEDIATGVLIAGQDLEGIKFLRTASDKKNLAWRLLSNDLIEASIPAGLSPGEHEIEFINQKGKALNDKLKFTVHPSLERTIVLRSTPSVFYSGAAATVVLQGIRLSEDNNLRMQKNGSSEAIALDNLRRITDRVLAAQVPPETSAGDYTIFVGDNKQDAKVKVK